MGPLSDAGLTGTSGFGLVVGSLLLNCTSESMSFSDLLMIPPSLLLRTDGIRVNVDATGSLLINVLGAATGFRSMHSELTTIG